MREKFRSKFVAGVALGLSLQVVYPAQSTSEYPVNKSASITPVVLEVKTPVTIFEAPPSPISTKSNILNSATDKEIESDTPFVQIEGKFQRVYDRFGGLSAIEITRHDGSPAIIFCWDQTPDDARTVGEQTNVMLKAQSDFKVGDDLVISNIPIGLNHNYRESYLVFMKANGFSDSDAALSYDFLIKSNKGASDALATNMDIYLTGSLADISKKQP